MINGGNSMDPYIILAIVLAIIVRIIIMPGYFVLPQKVDGKWQLNTIGTVIVAFVGILTIYNTNQEYFATPLGAFVFAYAVPYAIDAVSSKFQSNEDAAAGGGEPLQ